MQKTFPRSIDALGDIYAFTEHVMGEAGVGDAVRFPVHLAMEELFTNMVKYCPGNANDIRLEIDTREGVVAVTLIDFDVDEFDVTAKPARYAPVERHRGVHVALPKILGEGGIRLLGQMRVYDQPEVWVTQVGFAAEGLFKWPPVAPVGNALAVVVVVAIVGAVFLLRGEAGPEPHPTPTQ